MPQCGYSGTMVNILQSLSVPFETVDVLADDRIRQGIKVGTARGNQGHPSSPLKPQDGLASSSLLTVAEGRRSGDVPVAVLLPLSRESCGG